MCKLRKLRRLIFSGSVLWIAALVILPAIFGELQFLSELAIAGWVFLAVCSLIYMYGFIFWKDG